MADMQRQVQNMTPEQVGHTQTPMHRPRADTELLLAVNAEYDSCTVGCGTRAALASCTCVTCTALRADADGAGGSGPQPRRDAVHDGEPHRTSITAPVARQLSGKQGSLHGMNAYFLPCAGRRSVPRPEPSRHAAGSRTAAESGGQPPAHGAAVRRGGREVRAGPAVHPG